MIPVRILFVDDEPHVLDGLRNVLHRQRRVWSMSFALGGEAALEALDRDAYDVIVTDMRMPGMDGTELLQRVKQRCPSVARIVLTGHAETSAVFKALSVAHQYMCKPCDVEQLILLVNRTAGLQALVHDDAVRRVVSGLGKLPSVPRTYLAITEAAARPETSLSNITEIVQRDTALVAKVLQIVNSAYFGLSQHMTSIHQAVQYLGTETIRGLALAGEVFGTQRISPTAGFSLEDLQTHSEITARLVRQLWNGKGKSQGDLLAAAMVHDIGHIVLAAAMPEQCGEIRRIAHAADRSLHEIEREQLGGGHAEIGAYLLGLWGLPFSIVEATAYHHRPRLATPEPQSTLAAIHVAEALLDGVAAEAEGRTPPVVDVEFLAACGVQPDLSRWRDMAREVLESHAAA